MRKVMFFMIALMFFMPSGIKAQSCTVDEKFRLKSLAGNIVTTYDYVEKDGEVTFNITFNNVHSDLVIVEAKNLTRHKPSKKGISSVTIKNFEPGNNYGFIIIGNNKCNDIKLSNIYVNLPSYNPYYRNTVCNNSDSDLCLKWVNTSGYSESEFEQAVMDFSDIEEGEVQKEEIQKTFLDQIGDFLYKYYYFVLIVIIVVSILFIYILNKRNSFDLS